MLMHEESGRLKISAALGIGFWGVGGRGLRQQRFVQMYSSESVRSGDDRRYPHNDRNYCKITSFPFNRCLPSTPPTPLLLPQSSQPLRRFRWPPGFSHSLRPADTWPCPPSEGPTASQSRLYSH